MTDRELLELAAKAAGLRLTWGEKYKVGNDEVDCTDLPYALGDSPDEAPSYWNPLADDGDSFRLAVKLRVDVCWNDNEGPWEVNAWPRKGMGAGEDGEPDPYAATRRAIVRATASIGKDMK